MSVAPEKCPASPARLPDIKWRQDALESTRSAGKGSFEKRF